MSEFNVPKVELGFFPTPLQYLERLSKQLNYNLYLKRDDLTGPNLFGGNKIRKLEYLLGDALKNGADTLITFGTTQSNHAMETAVVARKLGLDVILYLEVVNEPDKTIDRGNLLIDKIFGAKIRYVSMAGITEEEADQIAMDRALAESDQLKQAGHHPYIIPVGGATPIGSAGFALGYQEAQQQLKDQYGQQVDYVFHGSGTGGTAAGLIAGISAFSDNPATKLISINVSPKPDTHPQKIANLANDALAYLGLDKTVSPDDLNFDFNYYGEGYEVPTEASSAAIRTLARTEGVLLDPVYTGKAFSGLLDYLKTKKIPEQSNVIFWHTGGISGLFAEPAIVGKLY